MLTHELLEYVLLLLLLAVRLPLPLHLLIIHHLLDHAPRLAIQVAQLAVLRCDLRGVDFGRVGYDVCPPVRPGRLLQVNADVFAGLCGLERPRAVVGEDGVGCVAVDEGFLAFDGDFEMGFLEFDDEVARFEVAGYRYCDISFSERLCPFVW